MFVVLEYIRPNSVFKALDALGQMCLNPVFSVLFKCIIWCLSCDYSESII